MKRLLTVLILALFAAVPAAAQPVIDINAGNLNPMPIAIPAFVGAAPAEASNGADIAGVVEADLESSGLFAPIGHNAFIEQISDINLKPRFEDWRIINAQALLTGSVEMTSDARMRVSFRLWDVFGEQEMLALTLLTTPENWRRVAHKIADAVYTELTGEGGYFDSRVVFVSESGPRLERTKRLAIMDQDGANLRFLTNGDYTVLTPRFSPSSQTIAYLSYQNGRPQVHLFDIETGRQETLGNTPNMTFAPRFSPDGAMLALTLEDRGNSDIYLLDLRTRQMRRLTTDAGIDTSPTFSPDGRRIVFESDRSGGQQLYIMNIDGSNVQRISFGNGRYATPVWSPRGDLIAFTRMADGQFYVGVMREDGSGERLLADGFKAEGPTWSPNGRVLMFFRQDRGSDPVIWSIDLTGQNLRRVSTPGAASDPAWSPLLQ